MNTRFAITALASVVLLSTSCSFVSSSAPNRHYSPNSTRYLVDTSDKKVSFAIYDRNGQFEAEIHSPASALHNYYFNWRSDERVVVESSDIGNVQYQRTSDGCWIEEGLYERRSPSRKRIAQLVRNYLIRLDTLTVAVTRLRDEDNGFRIIEGGHSYESPIRIGDVDAIYLNSKRESRRTDRLLADPLVWIDENTIAIVDRNGKELWRTKTE